MVKRDIGKSGFSKGLSVEKDYATTVYFCDFGHMMKLETIASESGSTICKYCNKSITKKQIKDGYLRCIHDDCLGQNSDYHKNCAKVNDVGLIQKKSKS